MNLKLEDIPPLIPSASEETSSSQLSDDSTFVQSSGSAGTTITGIDRRRFMKQAAGVLALIGVKSLGLFPPAKWAFADGYDMFTNIYGGPCHQERTDGWYGYAKHHNCSPGCGPSPVCGGGSNGHCCTRSGWHRDDHQSYWLRPNDCFNYWADGWKWKCEQNGIVYRCHDGWYRCCLDYYPEVCRANT